MSSAARAAELRALADKLEAAAVDEDEAAQAKAAYRDALASGDPEVIAAARIRHREAARAHTDSLSATRRDVVVGSSAPGSATVRVGTVRAGRPTVTEG